MFARTFKTNLKTLRYNFFTFSLRDFMPDSFTQSYPPPNQPKNLTRQITRPMIKK
ncbi:type III restriction endonuclease subunit R [Helicobacter pylori]|uniref:type III restriction endonuclease subunit R n=1 Tax=Helicobacter pylori TaxID=210 RepID=UPI00359C77CA